MTLEDFYIMLAEDAYDEMASGKYRTTDEALEGILCGYLEDEQIITDIQLCHYNKTLSNHHNMKISGIALDERSATLYLIVAKRYESKKMTHMSRNDANKMFKMVRRFYRKAQDGLYKLMEETDLGFTAAQTIYERQTFINEVKIYLVTNALVNCEPPEDVFENDTQFTYDIWDLDRFFRAIGQVDNNEDTIISFVDQYDFNLCMMKMPADHQKYDCFMGMIPGEILAQIYIELGQKLIERNVRSFLQARNSINKGIRDTVRDQPEMFMAYNNGISTVATWIETDEQENGVVSIKRIHGWQIVNGGQTTASLANAVKSNINLDQVFVPMKLTVLKSAKNKDLIIASISKYANSQNKITMSDFSANTPWHVEMEKLSRKIWAPTRTRVRWFYERARGQYMVDLNRQNTLSKKKAFRNENPKNHVITKTLAAKCLMCTMQKPYIVGKGSETNFVKFMEMVDNEKVPFPNEIFYKRAVASVILFQRCDEIVKNLRFGDFKANVVAYTIALAFRKDTSIVDLDEIWKNQNVSLELENKLIELANIVWNHITTPEIEGTNITQWCKREECWNLLLRRENLITCNEEEVNEDEL